MTSEETAAPADAPDAAAGSSAGSTPPATFRAVPLPALVAVGFLAIGLSPIAFQGGPWFLLLLLPLVPAWWVVRTRTVVDADELRVLAALGSRRLPWGDVATLRVAERGWVRAVRGDDGELVLTGVRARDLGRVAAASGGRITMPTPEEVEAAREHERELEATRLRLARLREQQAAREADAGTTVDESGDTDTDRQRSHSADTPDGDGGTRA